MRTLFSYEEMRKYLLAYQEAVDISIKIAWDYSFLQETRKSFMNKYLSSQDKQGASAGKMCCSL